MISEWGEYFEKNPSSKTVLLLSAVLVIANPIFFRHYWLPMAFYWDEGYHIASAAKYLTHTFFMEPHPPLGKLLIAFGEWFTNANHGLVYFFNQVPYISAEVLPEGFTFAGYRFMPALFGWLNVGLVALVFLEVLGTHWLAFFFTLTLYIFDNALVAQSRQAGLDSFMITGFLLCLLGFFRSLRENTLSFTNSLCMIFGFSFAVMTKAFAWALLVLWPVQWILLRKKTGVGLLMRTLGLQVMFFLSFAGLIWQTHFALTGDTVSVQLLNKGVFYASSDYEKIIFHLPGAPGRLEAYWVQLRDNLRFFGAYEDRVKPLDLDKGDATGSFPIMWPFGSRPLLYRWSLPSATDDTRHYLYMEPNPLVWFLCFLALLMTLGTLASEAVFAKKIFSDETRRQLFLLVALYFAFMLPLLTIRRVLYLNHYLLPFFVTMLMAAVLFREFWQRRLSAKRHKYIPWIWLSLPLLSGALFFYFSPLTYYEPVTCAEAEARNIFRFWNMEFPFCSDPAFGKVWKGPRESYDPRDIPKLPDI